MRKLASVRAIAGIEPIEDADSIELVRIDGWQCVAKKGEFKLGDLCIYFEIDSILPKASWSAFLGDRLRIKTRKMRGALSQGLALHCVLRCEPAPLSYCSIFLNVSAKLGLGFNKLPSLAVML